MTGEPVVEYGLLFSGGGKLIRPSDPEIERIYPLDRWIEHQRWGGGHVFRRTVIVVEDWSEVTPS